MSKTAEDDPNPDPDTRFKSGLINTGFVLISIGYIS